MFSDSSTNLVAIIAYQTLHNVFRLGRERSNNEQRARGEGKPETTSIISATIFPHPRTPLKNPVKLVFHHSNKVCILPVASIHLVNKCKFLTPAFDWIRKTNHVLSLKILFYLYSFILSSCILINRNIRSNSVIRV